MSSSIIQHNSFSPQMSGVLRYERVAKLEAVLKVRQKKRLARLQGMIVVAMIIVASVLYFLV